jgi:S-DNA-T family DNA segregation ATPase FtsK/SpoIIIE
MASSSDPAPLLPGSLRAKLAAWLRGVLGWALLTACCAGAASLLTWSAADPSFIRTSAGATRNALGAVGANVSDLAMRLLGLAAVLIVLPPLFWALQLITRRRLEEARTQLMLAPAAVLLIASAAAALPVPPAWPLPYGLGGLLGDQSLRFLASVLTTAWPDRAVAAAGALCLAGGLILLTGSLGMSLQDLVLICSGRRPLRQRLGHAWRALARIFERGGRQAQVRREPTFDLPPGAMTVGRDPTLPVAPTFGYEPPQASPGAHRSAPQDKRVRRPVRDAQRDAGRNPRLDRGRDPGRDPGHDAEFDQLTDTDSRTMAERFAPAREEPAGPTGFARLRRRGARAGAGNRARTEPRPVWPGSVPAPSDGIVPAAERDAAAAADALYGRAVALVRAQRKASAAYLQQSLGIGYMRAADLIERMEREGIVGSPVHNGLRPILSPAPGTRIV